MSPELLDPECFGLKESRLTKESDCYALGMVIYEILSGKAPFKPLRAPVYKILCGERPERPQGEQGTWFTDSIWEMLELCWKPHPGDRPSLNTVLGCLESATRPPRPYPRMVGDVVMGTDGQLDANTARNSSMFFVLSTV